MKSFEYAAPRTLKEAAALLNDKWGETEILAGGTDLVPQLRECLLGVLLVLAEFADQRAECGVLL